MTTLVNSSLSDYISKNIDHKMIDYENAQFRLYLENGFEWYVKDYDAKTGNVFGFVNHADPKNTELGYFNLNILEKLIYAQPVKNLQTSKYSRYLNHQVKIDYEFSVIYEELSGNGR